MVNERRTVGNGNEEKYNVQVQRGLRANLARSGKSRSSSPNEEIKKHLCKEAPARCQTKNGRSIHPRLFLWLFCKLGCQLNQTVTVGQRSLPHRKKRPRVHKSLLSQSRKVKMGAIITPTTTLFFENKKMAALNFCSKPPLGYIPIFSAQLFGCRNNVFFIAVGVADISPCSSFFIAYFL